jgi:hypothetical protein
VLDGVAVAAFFFCEFQGAVECFCCGDIVL